MTDNFWRDNSMPGLLLSKRSAPKTDREKSLVRLAYIAGVSFERQKTRDALRRLGVALTEDIE